MELDRVEEVAKDLGLDCNSRFRILGFGFSALRDRIAEGSWGLMEMKVQRLECLYCNFYVGKLGRTVSEFTAYRGTVSEFTAYRA